MRKNVIALSIAALVGGLGMAGGASAAVWGDNGGSTTTPTDAVALIVQPAGTGHILLVPYFNTQGSNATLLNIVNTDTVNGKAMKVRFRGAANSDDIFDFQLYLSPGDVWTANIASDAAGASRMLTSDKSCTLPGSINQSFVLDRLPPSFTTDQKRAWTREGYIEILNMADIPPKGINIAPASGAPLTTANALYTAIKHVAGVPPCTAATMNTLLADPASTDAAYTLGFRAPSGGVFANYMIVDVLNSGSYSGEATSISAVNPAVLDPVTLQPVPGRGNIVFSPQTGAAVGAAADLFTADPSLRRIFGAAATDVQDGFGAAYSNGVLPAPIIAAAKFDLPDLSTPYLVLGAYPPVNTDPIDQAAQLTDSMATMAIRNEVFTDPSVNAVTDWAFSMPTRRYHVALDYRTATPVPAYTNYAANGWLDYFVGSNTSVNDKSEVCVASGGLTVYDREETTQTSGFVISPGTSSVFTLCGETTVLSFNAGGVAAPSALGAAVARADIAIPYRDGWVSIATPGAGGFGLPVQGKAFMRASVPAGKFGLSFEHRYSR
jgi:hypothetical protein